MRIGITQDLTTKPG